MFTCTENMHHRKNGLCDIKLCHISYVKRQEKPVFGRILNLRPFFGLSYNKRPFFVFELAITPNFATKSRNFATKDSLGSNYPTVKFSSRNSKLSYFDTFTFFSSVLKSWKF